MLKRKEFDFVTDLMSHQGDMLSDKEEALIELYKICDNEEQRYLIKKLLLEFHHMNDEVYNLCLIEMKNYIVQRGFAFKESAVIAMCHDHMPDSSQDVLNSLKVYLGCEDWPYENFCNRFDRCSKLYGQGIRHFFIVDDFIGSGTTVETRISSINNQLKDKDFTFHFVFAAGMSEAVYALQHKGIDIKCAYVMDKCLSGKGSPNEINHNVELMISIENKLAGKVRETLLEDYSLGYKQSESLFCRKYKNVPNNVLPIFWWKEDCNNKKRVTLFNRIQDKY